MNNVTGIAAMKPAKRYDELVRQLGDVESDTVDLKYHTSTWDREPRTLHVNVIGISRPLDSNGKESLVVWDVEDDADRKPLTVGLHMIASVNTHVEAGDQ